MGKINLIDQLRKRASSGEASAPKASMFSFSKSGGNSQDVVFEDSSGGGASSLDAYEKRKIVMLLVGIMLVLGSRQMVPLYTAEKEVAVRNEIAQVEAQIATEQTRAQELKLVQEEMVEYEGRVHDLVAKLQKIRTLNEDRNLMVRMTDYIVKEMPNRLWFETLNLDTSTRVSIAGYSVNYQVVSDFMKKLEGAIYFPKWRLIQTEKQASAGTAAPAADSSAPANSSTIVVPLDAKKFVLEAETVKL